MSGLRSTHGGYSRLRVLRARLRFALTTRTRLRDVPWQVVLIGTKRPPEHVFEAFRRLHGIEDDRV